MFKKIGGLLFILLILVKVSAFHIYEHDEHSSESSDHCELCILAINSQQTALDYSVSFTLTDQTYFENVEIEDDATYVSRFFETPHRSKLYSRPPPII